MSAANSTFSFGDLTAIMFSLDVIDKQVGAQWRIKAWQRAGHLPDVGAGTGTRTAYSLEYVWTTCLLAKFQQIGVPPSHAIPMIREASLAPLSTGVLRFARDAHGSEIAIALTPIAQAIEARRAETTGSACESAVGSADAPEHPSTASTKASTNSPEVVDSGLGEQQL